MRHVWLPCPRCGVLIETPWYRCGPRLSGWGPITVGCARCGATLALPVPMRLMGAFAGVFAAGVVYYAWQRLFAPATDIVLLLQLGIVTAIAMTAFTLVGAAVTSRSRHLEVFEP